MIEFKLALPDRLAREAGEAGLLTQKAIRRLLLNALRRTKAARAFFGNCDRVATAGIAPMSEGHIQAEVLAVRKARSRNRAARSR